MNLAIEITNRQNHLPVEINDLNGLIRDVLEGESVHDASISVILVDDATIQGVNREQLGHDWPTDVITFPLSEPGESPLEAELMISAEMAVVTAGETNVDPQAELSLYLIHGLLHLCGYDDRCESDVASMRRREAEVLDRQGIVNTFAMVGPSGQGAAR